MDDTAKRLVESIMAINSASIDMFGGGLPGMLGSSAAVQGAMSPGADVAHALKKQAAAFYRAYYQGKDAPEAAAKLEEALLAAEAVSLIDTEQAGKLLDTLHNLMEARQ